MISHKEQDRIVRVLKKVIMHVDKHVKKETTDKSIWTAYEDEDRGLGWARGEFAAAVISHEQGLYGMYEPAMIEYWCKISDALGEYFIESINGGISVVYKV